MSNYIPRDIMIQILELLPVESLVRLRCVCKWMNQLIDSPSFIQDHLALQKPRFIAVYKGREFLVVNPASSPSLVSSLFTRRSESERVNLVGTLHGIVCFYYCNSHVMLCNLSIRKSLNLPLPDFKKFTFIDYESDGDVDDDRYGVFSGFWIDPSTKDFKIVLFKLLDLQPSSVTNAILYSSMEQDWKPVSPGKVKRYPSISESPPVVLGKMGYWRAWEEVEYLDRDGNPWLCTEIIVLSFDFDDEYCFGMIEVPWVGYPLLYPPVLSRWQDTLSLVFVNEENRFEVVLWEAQAEEDSWLKMLSFNMTTISRVLSMVESQGEHTGLAEELLENRMILATSSNELVLCNNGSACITLKRGLENDYDFSMAYDFVGSLLFP